MNFPASDKLTTNQGVCLLPGLVCQICLMLVCGAAGAEEFEGFLEPYYEIKVAAPEMGIIQRIQVREGAEVKPGDVLAELKHDILLASLEVAQKIANSTGKLKSAEAEARQRRELHRKYTSLHQRNHATQEEVERAAIDAEIAEAALLTVREELEVRRLECMRIEKQIEEHRVRSSIHGEVTEILKEVGEFVSSSDPVVMTVVQLDPLKVEFSVTPEVGERLHIHDAATLKIGEQPGTASGVVEFISPVIDAESGTRRIVIRLSNEKNNYRSGERCRLLPGENSPKAPVQTTSRPTSP